MSDLDRPRLALYVVLALAVCVLGARYLVGQAPSASMGGGRAAPGGESAPPRAEPTVSLGRADGGPVTVHVAGAVRHAGVYRLAAGSRVDDAIRRAGGPRRQADLAALNLAAKLEDGRQVLVPQRATGGAPASAVAGAGGGGATGAGAGAGAASTAATGPINLNTATLEQLDTLDGVGPAIAQRILAYRQQHGGFRSVDELAEVPGIGEKRLATLTPLVSV